MSDLIDRDNLSKYKEKFGCKEPIEVDAYYSGWNNAIDCIIENEPSAQPKDWIEQSKDSILQAGNEGREVEFRIGGRLFAIREKAQ